MAHATLAAHSFAPPSEHLIRAMKDVKTVEDAKRVLTEHIDWTRENGDTPAARAFPHVNVRSQLSRILPAYPKPTQIIWNTAITDLFDLDNSAAAFAQASRS